jgi:carboxypeptidase C (cathepsin A)
MRYCKTNQALQGGRWGPEFAAYFEQQNQKIDNGTIKGCNGTSEATKLDLDTLLIINGCADRLTMWPTYVKIASDNTYGIKAINDSQVRKMEDAWDMPGGCRDQVLDCHEAARVGDPKNLGDNATVNAICEDSETFCYSYIMDGYRNSTDRGYFDIGTIDGSSPKFHQAFLNQPHVQKAIGVPLNWTSSSSTVKKRFKKLGAYPRDASLPNMAYLLENGVKVALMYGDRDFACNWYGGEQVSLAIPHSEQDAFKVAGYTPLMTNASYSGGQVRQHGNLSFSRVYEAGHEVASYQPETAYRIFMRAIFGLDIATGQVSAENYTTIGPEDTYNILNKPLDPQPLRYCYSWSQGSCSDDEKAAMLNGSATVCSYILKDKNSTQLFPEITGRLDEPGCGMGLAHY